MKKLSLLIVCLICSALTIPAQTHTQTISFDDGVGPGNAGTYSPSDSFSVDLYLTFNGYNSYGFSLWMETTANAAPFISLAGMTHSTTFPDFNQFVPFPLGFTLHESNGMFTTPNSPNGGPSDLGAIVADPHAGGVAPGTYFLGQLTISLNGLPPGVYVLQTDATGGHQSISISGDNPPLFMDEPIPPSAYTITVVPEPGTVSLIGLGIIGLTAVCRRSKRFHT